LGKLVGFLFTLVVIAAVAAAGAWFWINSVYTAEGPTTADGKPRVVMVSKGGSVRTISTKLKEAGAIADDNQFRLALRVSEFVPGSSQLVLKAGEYDIPSGASMKAIVELLSSGKAQNYVVVVPEGLTSAMILNLLAEEEWNTTNTMWRPTDDEIAQQRAAFNKLPVGQRQGKKFRAKWGRTVKLEGPVPAVPAEGVLLPGDYAVQPGNTIESVIDRMIKAQQDLLAELWPNRQAGLPFKTPEEAVNLASIVENETGVPHERPQVASLFVNRLNKSMRLQSDPTIVYGITRGVPLGHGLRRSEIDTKTDWNTYQVDGLPKTPICNPGRESIAAVLNPAQTSYIYFVADGSGGHAFAETLGQHNANVSKWREIEKQRDAKEPAAVGAKP
jgi:UPF0755 protein